MAEEQPPPDQTLATLATAQAAELVAPLMERMAQRQPGQEGLLRQLTEICAFLPPKEEGTLDDFFLYCDLEAVGLEVMMGRATFEKLVGEFVRYGLLDHDPFTGRYTAGNRVVQQALQAYVYPSDGARQVVARRRRRAAAVLRHVQRESEEVLPELAHRIDAEEGNMTPSLLAPYLLPPFRRLLQRSTKAERQRMASALGKFPSALAVEALMLLLEDEEGQVRSRAVQSLADLDGLHTLPALLKALQDPNGDVRWIAALALGKLEGPEIVEALMALLTDEDKEVGRIAAEGLGQKGDRRAVPHLIAAARDSYPLLRESAALALGQLADTRALPALQELLQDASMQVRRCAEQALARIAPTA
jgi:HEAT repeat protein